MISGAGDSKVLSQRVYLARVCTDNSLADTARGSIVLSKRLSCDCCDLLPSFRPPNLVGFYDGVAKAWRLVSCCCAGIVEIHSLFSLCGLPLHHHNTHHNPFSNLRPRTLQVCNGCYHTTPEIFLAFLNVAARRSVAGGGDAGKFGPHQPCAPQTHS